MRLIVDCSAAVPWIAARQATAMTDAAFDYVTEHGATVPAHFHIELINALYQLERRGWLEATTIDTFLAELDRFSLEVDLVTTEHITESIFPLARRYGLTLYDAAYLELALRSELPLATRDEALAAAAGKAGAKLFAP